MSKVVNITDKFVKDDKGQIKIGEKTYEVEKSLEAVLRFEEADNGGVKGLLAAIEGVLGEEASQEIGVRKMSIANIKILMLGLMAAMQDVDYDEAAARFPK